MSDKEGPYASGPHPSTSPAAHEAAGDVVRPGSIVGLGAVMWLGAWRGKGLFALPGVLAYLTAIVLHSVNDGVFGGLLHGVSPLLALVGTPIMLVVIYTVFRRHVRELVPPSRIAAGPARWRPRLSADPAGPAGPAGPA